MSANNVAALCAKGANKSSGRFGSNHNSVVDVLPLALASFRDAQAPRRSQLGAKIEAAAKANCLLD
jgi:hypothetical protein